MPSVGRCGRIWNTVRGGGRCAGGPHFFLSTSPIPTATPYITLLCARGDTDFNNLVSAVRVLLSIAAGAVGAFMVALQVCLSLNFETALPSPFSPYKALQRADKYA
ncbi:hypothetical protein HYPSUDRAFT_201402 [Hypholoma sublateritium FD-334 SS-4]|uniref:Uncharacterized protein n=1 Tax=Hypholoma sublateritium (strain FD-334 SS-4) TaxID=945553 RepID=A0A0D2MI91_HYPSF|nr:hypothetical protein HYPSUDRAFT_201402 [Hypholoma sublateritium FD-334 SS-4]